MTFWMAKASPKDSNQKFLLIDKASHRHKFDNKLKDDAELNVARIRADIQDLKLDSLPGIAETKVQSVQYLCASVSYMIAIHYF